MVTPVMAVFVCGLLWATGCPDIQSNIVPSVSLGIFWGKIDILMVRVKHISLLNVTGPHPIISKPKQNKKADPSPNK